MNANGTPHAPNFDAPVSLDLTVSNAPGGAATVQLAVLVFLKPPRTFPAGFAGRSRRPLHAIAPALRRASTRSRAETASGMRRATVGHDR